MLGAAGQSRKKRVAPLKKHALPALGSSDRQRIVELIRLAREKLEALAAIDPSQVYFANSKMSKLWESLGMFDGVGFFTNVASFKLDAGGTSLSEAEFERFRSEGQVLIDNLISSALNYSVINSLLFTIYISLLVLTAGDSAYQPPVIGHFNATGPPFGVWSDFATFAWPDDIESQATGRRVFYAIECALLCLGIASTVCGIFASLLLYTMMSVGLPSVLSKIEYIAHNPKRLYDMFNYSLNGGLDVLTLVLPFIAARCSALAFFCSCGSFFLVHGVWAISNAVMEGGLLSVLFKTQHNEARRAVALGNNGAKSEGASCSAHAGALVES